METISPFLKKGSCVYLVGIKGTGVSAFAELLHEAGVKVLGSDTEEVFYTDSILKELGIPYYESFDAGHISGDIDLVIHSPAYNEKTNPELAEALRKAIPVLSYPQALGLYSADFNSCGITGVHGKTTTTAMCGTLMQGLGLQAQILAGSAVCDFGGKSTLTLGKKFFIAETCEYRKNFLFFHPRRIVLTSVESDHQDFFHDYKSIRDAFAEYCRLLPDGGELIYCADDPGASEVAGIIAAEERGIVLIPYGFSASGDYRLSSYRVGNGRAFFRINALDEELALFIPGRHQALNAAAAIALSLTLLKDCNETHQAEIKKALEEFRGSKRRSEIIGKANDIIFMDDYGHHPTAIKSTLEGIKNFYPSRRLVVSFMSHTYTRTAALLKEFADSLKDADLLFLHKIYASPREKHDGKTDGKSIYNEVLKIKNKDVYYTDEPLDAFDPLMKLLKPGDIFLTLGAGNNWPLGVKLYEQSLI